MGALARATRPTRLSPTPSAVASGAGYVARVDLFPVANKSKDRPYERAHRADNGSSSGSPEGGALQNATGRRPLFGFLLSVQLRQLLPQRVAPRFQPDPFEHALWGQFLQKLFDRVQVGFDPPLLARLRHDVAQLRRSLRASSSSSTAASATRTIPFHVPRLRLCEKRPYQYAVTSTTSGSERLTK